jgi:hypothetical protein
MEQVRLSANQLVANEADADKVVEQEMVNEHHQSVVVEKPDEEMEHVSVAESL